MPTSSFIESGSDATQDFTFWDGTLGTVTSDSAVTHTGSRSIRLTTTTTAELVKTAIMADAGRRLSIWYRFDALPATTSNFLLITDPNDTNEIFTFRMDSSGHIQNEPLGVTLVTGTATIALNTWYRITVAYTITDATHFQVKLFVNGILDSSINTGTLSATGTTDVRVRGGAGFGVGNHVWIDDAYIDSGSTLDDPGDIRVIAKRPNANGTANQFTTQIGVGGSGYGTGHSPQVNELPLSTTNGWSFIGAGPKTEEYNIESASTGAALDFTSAILDYVGWVYASALISETGQIVLNNDATTNIALTSTNTMFTKFAGSTTYPAGTGTDVGIVSDATVTTVSLYECGIVFAVLWQSGPDFTEADCTEEAYEGVAY